MTTINTIREKFLKLDMKLIAGSKNTDKEVDYITILELPEKTNRFKEKGLVLSTFQPFRNVEHIKEQISWLQTVGIVGIGFHKAHYKTVPHEIVEHAAEINMPLFSIPVDVPYHKILDIFNQLENDDLDLKTYEIYKINEKMMESVFSEKDPGYIINLMGNYIKENIVLLDAYLKVRAIWKTPLYPQDEMDRITQMMTSTHKETLLQTRFFKRDAKLNILTSEAGSITLNVTPISSKDAFYGYLIVNNQTMQNFYNKEVIRMGLRAMTLNANQSSGTKDHYKMKDINKFESLINNTSENMTSNDFYVSTEYLNVCMRVTFSSDKIMKDAFSSLSEIILEKKSNAIIWIFEGSLIAYLEGESELSELNEVLNFYPDKSIGVSARFDETSLNDIKLMNRQAQTALKYSQYHSQEIYEWDTLGVERVAYNISETDLFHSLDKDILGSLIDHDRQKNSELMMTLDCCLKHFFNLKTVGQELHVHPNTVKYRLKQITEILNIDMHERSNYALLVMAFIIHDQKGGQ